MRKSWLTKLWLGLFTLGALSDSVLACTCEHPPPPCVEYWCSDAVFVGQVSKVSNEGELLEKVNISVEENFKGMSFSTARTGNYSTSCNFRFREGERFLFYGMIDTKQTDHFGTGYCTRTRRLEPDLPDLEFLRILKNKDSAYWVWVTVNKGYPSSPIKNVLAEVIGIKPRKTARSNENGDLKIVVPSSGKYKVRIWLPKGKEWSGSLRMDEQLRKEQQKIWRGGGKTRKGSFMDFEVEVGNNRCGWIDLPLMNAS